MSDTDARVREVIACRLQSHCSGPPGVFVDWAYAEADAILRDLAAAGLGIAPLSVINDGRGTAVEMPGTAQRILAAIGDDEANIEDVRAALREIRELDDATPSPPPRDGVDPA